MADISKIKLPNNSVVNIKDARITGVDTTPTSGSTNVVTSGGIHSAIQSAISSVYKYKGTKANYASLPSSGNVTGDVWNVEAAYGDYPAGTNWAWTGSGWDALGGEIDLSSYLTKTDASNTYLPIAGGTITGALTVTRDTTLNGGAKIKGTGNAVTNINGGAATVDYAHVFVTGGTNNTRPLVLQNGYGNVGIGVTTPTQKLEVNGNIKATSFIKSGGTSSQFLKADGSDDSNTYLKSSGDTMSGTLYTKGVQLGSSIPVRTDSVNTAPRYGNSINMLGLTGYIEGLKVNSAEGDYFYCADRNSDFTVTSNYKSDSPTVGEYSGTDLAYLFDLVSSNRFMLYCPNLEENPWILTIIKNSGTITATDVLDLWFFQTSNVGYLNSYKIEVLTNITGSSTYDTWFTVIDRDDVQDRMHAAAFPIWLKDETHGVTNHTYGYIKGVRITIRKADPTGTWKTDYLPICAVQLRDRRPSHKPSAGIGAMDMRGGTFYGNVWFDYGDLRTKYVVPVAYNAYPLGTSSYRWSNIYSVLGNFSGALTASSFIKSGGTSSQFLKADGSVDPNTYATTNALNDKQDKLTFDSTPTANSANPVTSGGLNTEFGKVSYVGDNLGTETYVDSGSVVTDLSGYATKAWVEAKGYLTTESDPGVYAWAKAATKPTYTASEVGALPDTTEIPSKLSDLTNDMGFIVGYSFDNVPTLNSSNPVKSGGVYSAISSIRQLPAVSSSDNGKILKVINGVWTAVADTTPTLYSGTSAPSSSLGSDGDIYLQTS